MPHWFRPEPVFFVATLHQVIQQPGFWPAVISLACWQWLFVRASKWLPITAILALPGTMLHEMAHVCVGVLTFARPTSVSLWPRRERGLFVLGEVRFRCVGYFNGAPVALAPLLLLPLVAWLFLGTVHAWSGNLLFWATGGYLTAVLLRALIPSSADVRVAAPSIMAYAVFCAGVGFLLSER
jgi:hypothetical protein